MVAGPGIPLRRLRQVRAKPVEFLDARFAQRGSLADPAWPAELPVRLGWPAEVGQFRPYLNAIAAERSLALRAGHALNFRNTCSSASLASSDQASSSALASECLSAPFFPVCISRLDA